MTTSFCFSVQCEAPGTPANGTAIEQLTFSFGDTIKLSCLPGYDEMGETVITCESGGEFSVSDFFCKPGKDGNSLLLLLLFGRLLYNSSLPIPNFSFIGLTFIRFFCRAINCFQMVELVNCSFCRIRFENSATAAETTATKSV